MTQEVTHSSDHNMTNGIFTSFFRLSAKFKKETLFTDIVLELATI